MRVFLLILSVTVAIQASKERAPLQGLPKEEKDILFELVKRLENDGDLDKHGWKDTAQCDVSPNRSSIIKKKESLNNGAQFLTLYKGVESNEACSDLCCKNVSCDLAVFENKDDHYCYLFRCEGNCKFGHHSSYISNNIVHRPQLPPSSADGSERDLIDLGRGSDTNSKNNDDSYKTSTAAATSVATPASTYIRAHSVGLEGPYCERDLHCEDPAAICNYNKCRCREDYYRKNHICRQVCPASNFECLELGTLGRGPQCVSQQEVCDGITQCADGSDEFNCPDSGAPPIRTWQQQNQHLPSPAEPPQQQQELHSPQQQQQSFSHTGYVQPQNSKQAAPPVDSAGQTNNHMSPQGFQGQGQGQHVGQVDNQPYQAYSPQQQVEAKQQQSQGAGQSQRLHQQSAAEIPAPASSNGYNGNSVHPKVPASSQQHPEASNQQQEPEGNQSNYQNAGMSQSQPVRQPQQPMQKVPTQSGNQQYPQHSQQSYSETHPKEPNHKAFPQQPYENLSPQQAYANHQQSAAGPDSQKPGSQRYNSAGTQQYLPSHGQLQEQSVADSRRPPNSHSSAQSMLQQNHPQNNRIYTEGGGMANSQNAASQGQLVQPIQEQNSQQQTLSQPRPNAPRVGPGAAGPPHSKPSGKSDTVAGARPQGPRTTEPSLVLIDGHKNYVVPGHSKVQNDPDAAYQSPVGKGIPEEPRHHSAYDVRIGEPNLPLRKMGNSQKSFLNPEELNDLDAQGPSRFLDGFGDQYLPQQSYGQQYSPYSRYSSSYQQGSGGQGNGYSGISDQLYPGSPSQRVYPQQGYLDFGYPSSQYEFGEFDPPYAESDTYPGSHDFPSYRPSSKLGYDGSYKGQGIAGKDDKHTHEGNQHKPGSGASPKAKGKVIQPTNSENGEAASGVDTDDKPVNTATDSININQPSDKAKEGDQESSSEDDTNKTDKSEDLKPAEVPSSAEKTDSSSKEEKGAGDSSEISHEEKGLGSNSASSDLVKSQDAFISRERVHLKSEQTSMQGPIIALSLGLAFTVILLIFVACRLRTVRRRLRKGRPLHSNEADYLINGMYL